MKTKRGLVSAAFLVVGVAIAAATAAIAQETQGGMGPGMMGPRMMQAGMGQGMMCPMMGAMMQDGMRQSMMGSGMMRSGGAAMFGTRVTPIMNLSIDDVRSYFGLQLERINNKRLKLGNVSADDGAISADIVTVDNSLVQRLKVDRHTGAIEYEN